MIHDPSIMNPELEPGEIFDEPIFEHTDSYQNMGYFSTDNDGGEGQQISEEEIVPIFRGKDAGKRDSFTQRTNVEISTVQENVNI